jgi:hypothetical protein
MPARATCARRSRRWCTTPSRLDLSRIEAACLPENAASRGVLETCGFKYEGVAQSYLQINGRWRTTCFTPISAHDRRGRVRRSALFSRGKTAGRPQMIRSLVLGLALLIGAGAAAAQDRRPSHCIAIADAAPGLQYLHRASFSAPIPEFSVRIHYIDHAMFLIRTQGGLNVVTDYNGFIGGADLIPDVVTMNHAHSTHWTPFPDPAIPHVLEGWGEELGLGIDHHLDLGEMLMRNVSTDIRRGFGDTEANGNSIFVFEVEGLCIGHLGHLHHEPNEEQYAALGRLDVVMAPVDGGLTLPIPVVTRILKRLKSSVVIPMHWFGRSALERFLIGMADEFEIIRPGTPSLEVSLRTLPDRPTVVVLEPEYLQAAE